MTQNVFEIDDQLYKEPREIIHNSEGYTLEAKMRSERVQRSNTMPMLKVEKKNPAQKMKIAVVGSRTFSKYALLKQTLDEYGIETIVSGGARGADSLAARYAKENSIRLIELKPDWQGKGKSAGFQRNGNIVDESDGVIAFWDGVSCGTFDTIQKAKRVGKLIKVIKY